MATGARARLARLGRRRSVPLGEGALAFAALQGIVGEVSDLDQLAAGLDRRAASAPERAEELARVLADFSLDPHEVPAWPQVLERRQGSPAGLAILWLEVAERAGWPAEALGFPAFLPVRLEGAKGGRAIVDPATGGRQVEARDLRAALKAVEGLAAELRPSLFAPLANRDILLRLQNEAKFRALHTGRIADALAIVECMLAFAPDQDILWREAGMMHLRLENLPAAIAALEQFVGRTANPVARRRAEDLLSDIRARMS